jgi:hypothetical protein
MRFLNIGLLIPTVIVGQVNDEWIIDEVFLVDDELIDELSILVELIGSVDDEEDDPGDDQSIITETV